MPRVDFYVLNDKTEKEQLSLACKLASKAYQTQQHLYIYCNNQAQAATVDDMLWSFNAISFIPHGLVQQHYSETLPILIGHDEPATMRCDLLLNLHHKIPTSMEHCKRIIEIVYQDPEVKKLARAHYKVYQDRGFALETHHLH